MRTSSLLLVAIAIVAVCFAATAPGATAIVGGWSPIKDINDTHIQGLGRWAVSVNNDRVSPSDQLTLNRVTGGEQQVVDGINYRLDIDASSRSDANDSYKAVVFEQYWSNSVKLISFDKNHS